MRTLSVSEQSTRYCNYSKDKFGNEITVIKPCFLEENTEKYNLWLKTCENCEKSYFEMLNMGMTPQEARSILPNSLKTEIVMTLNISSWRNFLELRNSKAAHPQMREIATMIYDEFEQKYGVLVEVVEPSNSSGVPLIRINSNLKTASPERNTPQVYYMYNNNVNQNQVIAKLKSTGIESAEKEDRLYDVKVEIYDKSVGLSDISGKDPIVTFTGSMVE